MKLSSKATAICTIAEYKCTKCLLKDICLKEYDSEEQKAMEMNHQAQFIKQSVIDDYYKEKRSKARNASRKTTKKSTSSQKSKKKV